MGSRVRAFILVRHEFPSFWAMMRTILVVFCLLQLSSALFFGRQRDCRSNNECPNIRRRAGQDCSGNFNLFGLRIPTCNQRYSNLGGRCVNKRDGFCNFANAFGGNRNCNIRRCAECLSSEDCPNSNCQLCQDNKCVDICQRERIRAQNAQN